MAEAPGSGSPQHHSNAPTGLKDPWGHADALIQTMRWIRTKNGEPLGASRFNHDTPMAVLNWQGRRHFAFGERPREASS